MKKRVTRLIVPAMLILLGTCFQFSSPQPNQAWAALPAPDGRDFLIWQRTFGMTATQKARVTVANLSSGRHAEQFTFQCLFFDRNGALVYQTPSVEVPVGGFRHSDILHADVTDSTGTTAIWRADLLISPVQVGGTGDPKVVGSFEIIDVATGKTTVYSSFDSNSSTR